MIDEADSTKTKRNPRRWVQFSLRTALLMTAVTALLLFAYRAYIAPMRLQQVAGAAVFNAGGICQIKLAGPQWLRRLLGDKQFRTVVSVELPQPEIAKVCEKLLPRLAYLESLSVCGAAFTDKQLLGLRRLKRLRQITLRGTMVTDVGIAKLKQELPEVSVICEPLEITFDDLDFKMSSSKPFQYSFLTDRIRCLDGSRVRIRGDILPSFKQTGIEHFVLVRSNLALAPLSEVIVVHLEQGRLTTYSTRPITVEGTLSIEELRDPIDGELRAVFRMDNAIAP